MKNKMIIINISGTHSLKQTKTACYLRLNYILSFINLPTEWRMILTSVNKWSFAPCLIGVVS